MEICKFAGLKKRDYNSKPDPNSLERSVGEWNRPRQGEYPALNHRVMRELRDNGLVGQEKVLEASLRVE